MTVVVCNKCAGQDLCLLCQKRCSDWDPKRHFRALLPAMGKPPLIAMFAGKMVPEVKLKHGFAGAA